MANISGGHTGLLLGGFIWLGYKLDTWLQTEPLCMVIFGLIGAITGFYMLYKQVK